MNVSRRIGFNSPTNGSFYVELKWGQQPKYLGIVLDSKLSF